MLDRPGVLRLFVEQHWVAGAAQLRALGVSDEAMRRARRCELVEAVLPGVVGVSSACGSIESRAMAVQLAARGAGFISGVSAGRLYGLREMAWRRIEYTMPQDRRIVAPPWLRLVCTSWRDEEPRPARDDGLIIASPLRMLFDLAARCNQHRFERAAEDAWHRGLIDPDGAADYLARIRRRGRTGVSRMAAWLDKTGAGSRPSQSALELDLVDMIEQAGLPPAVRQHPLVLASGETIHLDLAWPDIRLALEPGHSWWHGGDLRARADQDRDRACGEVGWMVARFDESLRDRRPAIVRQLRSIYTTRRRQFAPGSGF
ncbi:MAG: hypothetical protein ACRDZZ_11280 [Ilumatobacteraceae bacterium]